MESRDRGTAPSCLSLLRSVHLLFISSINALRPFSLSELTDESLSSLDVSSESESSSSSSSASKVCSSPSRSRSRADFVKDSLLEIDSRTLLEML